MLYVASDMYTGFRFIKYPSTFTTNQNEDFYSKQLASRREMGCITSLKPLKLDTSDSAAS